MSDPGRDGARERARPHADPGPLLRTGPGGAWLLFERCVEVVEAVLPDEVLPALRRVEGAVEEHGLHAAGFLSYEAASAFDPVLRTRGRGALPLVWFGLYAGAREVELPGVEAHPEPGDGLSAVPSARDAAGDGAPLPVWTPCTQPDAYRRAIDRIRAAIADGHTYQANFTVRLRTPDAGDPWRLFLRLVAAQEAPYGAWIDTGRHAICSASPELFFRLENGRILSRPMKGTARRGRTPAEDRAARSALEASEKDRAENLMILDMVRSDLGRIARPGSVQVPEIFAIEAYPTVWQMVSAAEAWTGAGVVDCLAALFPAASITGAPRRRTMEILSDLETSPRGIYTGCIGAVLPGRRAWFNVAIRTAVVDRATGAGEYGVGGGIVWDSRPDSEWRECRAKAQVLGEACLEMPEMRDFTRRRGSASCPSG